jgi:hypothetical protein
MAAFDHVAILLSFVYALALTHVLSRMAGLLFARERLRFSGLLLLWMINAIILIFENWLSLWDSHGLRTWTLYSIVMQFLFAVAQYFLCAMAAPDYPAEGRIDMPAMYARTRVPLYGFVLAVCLLAIASNADMMRVNASLFLRENLLTAAGTVPVVLALANPARWAQWVGGLCALLNGLVFLTFFENALR